VKKLVIDASVAVKWVVTESGTPEALRLLNALPLIAPDLLLAECANILWKKVQRKELSEEEAVMASRILQRADIEISPMRQLLERATRLAIELDHPAYDCVYLALALENGWQFVTADDRFLRKLRQGDFTVYNKSVASMGEALDGLRGSNG
jgi:predicted nucleic acid-binding protein